MVPGVSTAAVAMNLLRSTTSSSPASGEKTPATASAASSPSECPATATGTMPLSSSVTPHAQSARYSSGWATRVSASSAGVPSSDDRRQLEAGQRLGGVEQATERVELGHVVEHAGALRALSREDECCAAAHAPTRPQGSSRASA